MPLRDDKAKDLRDRVTDLVTVSADRSPVLAGWLALDLAQSLLQQARAEFGPTLTPNQQDDLEWITDRLRVLATEV
ncbi:MAG: hypothetical protein AAGF30_13155 [Pseudomonadota bacterium]